MSGQGQGLPGNVMVLRDVRIGLLDFGAVGVLDAETRLMFAVLVNAALAGDPVGATDAIVLAFDVPQGSDRGPLRRELIAYGGFRAAVSDDPTQIPPHDGG